MPAIALALAVVAFVAGGVAARLIAAPSRRRVAPAPRASRVSSCCSAQRARTAARSARSEWRAFLDTEVTPRFPDGLTVLTGYGQWRSEAGRIAKEASRVLVIWYQPGADSEAKIEAIRSAYKARFGQESVMRVDGTSCVSF